MNDAQAIFCDPSGVNPGDIGTISTSKGPTAKPILNRFGNDDCEELPPITVTGYSMPTVTSVYFWMGGGIWYHVLHPGSGGGVSATTMTQEKLDFCKLKDDLNALISALPITGTVSTGYSIAEGSFGWASAIYNTALRDIEQYIASDTHVISYANGTVNWYDANINWNQYNNWTNNSTLGNGALPTQHNGGSIHVFANFLLQTGQGNGSVDQMLANQDPQPNVDC